MTRIGSYQRLSINYKTFDENKIKIDYDKLKEDSNSNNNPLTQIRKNIENNLFIA